MDRVPEFDDRESQLLWNTYRGDKNAFREIISRNRISLTRLSCFYLGDWEEARDACQEIFLKVYMNMDRFEFERPFRPWFYSIALNHLRRRYGEIKKIKDREITLPEKFCCSPGSGPLKKCEEEDICRQVRTAIEDLPPLLKKCTRLYYLDQLHIKEICSVMNLEKENVKSRLFRARKILKKNLHDLYSD